MKQIFYLILISFLTQIEAKAQDAFFYESKQIRSYLNPALTGLNGSLSLNLIGKEQFLNDVGDFISGGASIEQSWPCSKIDVGLYHVFDKEGIGSFKTNHTAANFVYTLPVNIRRTLHNFRLGTKLQYTNKSIDWDGLTFSDQIDPKYNLTDAFGVSNNSDFTPPNWNSVSRLTMGLGLVHKVDLGLVYKWSLTWGVSVENYTNAFESEGYDSILALENDKNRLIDKWSFYFAPEFPLTKSYKDYFGFRPSIVLLQESTLLNLQVGFDTNYRRAYGLGLYFGTGSFNEFEGDTKSLIFNTYVRALSTKNSQLNIGFQYVHNIGGLSETFGQTLQVSISYNLKQDGCASTPTTTSDCPPTSRRHKLLYENIWFSPVEGINK